MHRFISFNRQITSSEKKFLPLLSSAAFYGKGVFSTIAVYRAKPFLWEKHWRRLNNDAGKTGLDLSEFSEEDVKNSLFKIIEKNNFQTGRARITFFDENLSGVWDFESKRKTSLLIATANSRRIKNNFSLIVSPFRLNSLSPLAGIKSCNYLEKLLALKDAEAKGFDEAVCLNERGEIASASTANIFWVKNEQIFTPSLKSGCLAGTTREFILENFAVREKQIGIKEIIKADEIFLTSAGIGVRKVRKLENNPYPFCDLTEKLQKFLERKARV